MKKQIHDKNQIHNKCKNRIVFLKDPTCGGTRAYCSKCKSFVSILEIDYPRAKKKKK
jgi:hypothetical protein